MIDRSQNDPATAIDWRGVVKELSPGLLNYFQSLFPRQVAADLVQETLLRLVVAVRTGAFNKSKGSLRMYCYGIARLVRLEGRRKEWQPQSSAEPDDIAGDSSDEPRIERQRLRWAVAQLKPEEQEIILLLLDRDLTLAEIADLLGLPNGTVKSHMHRAKKSLKAILQRAEVHQVR